MLTRDVMGVLALAILWVNALLVAGAALKQARELWSRRRALGAPVEGRVIRGDGPGGAFAVHRVAQVGRALVDGETIVFHDRSAAGELFGGAIAVAGAEQEIGSRETAEVWLRGSDVERATACSSSAMFEEALAVASKAKGYARTVDATVTAGAAVFVVELASGATIIATEDPRAVLARKAALGAAFVVAELVAAALCTALALTAPLFGAVSTIGGALGLAYFLGVQPLGVTVRDAMRVPSETPVRGAWARPT